MPATPGGETTVANHLVKGDGPGNRGMEGQAPWGAG